VSLIKSDSLLSRLRTSKIGQSLLILEECTSTNDIAAQMANSGAPHGFTVFAEKQTKGRGRRGRTWFSPEGGIWGSVVLRPPRSFEPLEGIQLIGALAVVQAITVLHGIKTSVRWPNDVMFNNRKVAGALVEARFKGNLLEYAILGLGVNVNFPSSLLTGFAGNVTTISDAIGHSIDRTELASYILYELEHIYETLCAGSFSEVLQSLRQNDCSQGRKLAIEFEKEVISGVFHDYLTLTVVQIIDDHGMRRDIEASSAVSVAYRDA